MAAPAKCCKSNLIEKPVEPVAFSESSKLVLKLAYNPIIGSFFHPMYSIINAGVLGHAA